MSAVRVLLIEDDPGLAASVEADLEAGGFAADLCHDGQEGLLMALTGGYGGIVLDLMLRDANGYRVSGELRRLGVRIPVLGLASKDEEAETLDREADDILAQPFSCLVSRLQALLQGGVQEPASVWLSGDLVVDLARRSCRRGEAEVPLTPRECSLLELLLRRAGQVVSAQEILDQVWDFAFERSPRMIDRAVSSLRRKLDCLLERQSIQTIEGMGYWLL